MSLGKSPDGYHHAVLSSLKLIARIQLRSWPSDAQVVTFHDSYESDAAMVRRFCKNKTVFGRTSRYFVTRWDIVNYLSPDHFMFYLPAILLAMLEYPKSQLSSFLISSRLYREQEKFSKAEKAAVKGVELCLAVQGITRESVLRDVAEGKAKARMITESGVV